MTKKLTVIMLSILMLFSMSLALTACGKDDEPQQPVHTHTYATDWTTDETYHWHKCTGDGCNEVKNKAEHTYTNGVCVCGKTEPTPHVQKMSQTEWENTFDFSNVTITVYQAGTKESLNLLTEDSAIKYLIAGDNMSMESTVLSMNIPSSLKSEIIKSYDFSNEYDNVVFNNGKYTLDEYTFTSMEESVTYQDVEFVFANGKIQSFTAKVITEVDYGSGPETETTYTKVEFDNYGTTIVEEKAELPITQQQFVEIFSTSNFENVTIDYHDYIELGTINGETKTPSGDPIEITVNIKYADQKSSFDYYNDNVIYLSYFYDAGDVYEWNSIKEEYELFKVRYQNDAFYVLNLETGKYDDLLTKQEVLNMLELLPETLLSSIVNFSENDGIMYQLLTYDEETSLYTIDLAGIAMFTFRIEDDKLSYLSMYSYMEFENEYSIFDVVYTFSDYGETEISLPHIHNFNLEQVEAKYLANGADCIHYATYYKSCECGAKGTETFEYKKGGYGEHINTESKGKVEPTCHTFGYEAGEYCNDCQQYISGHGQIAMTPHSWIEDTKNSKEANCTEAGVKAYKCSCEGCEATKTEVGDPAKNHSVSSWTEKSKVKVDGTTKCEYTITYEGICDNCKETITKIVVEERHEFYWTVTKEPTCKAAGEKTEYCLDENCKWHTPEEHATDVYKLPEGADGHNWVVDAKNSNKFICSHCSAEKTIVSSSGNTLSGSNLTTFDEIQLSTASVSMNDAMKSALTDAELSITAEEKNKEDVLASVNNEADREKISNAKAVFDFTLTKDGAIQSELGGELTIRIPYILQPGDDPDKIFVVCILENGDLQEFPATYANNYITFKTTHFSVYSVVELTPAEYCAKYHCHESEYITANPGKFKVIAPTCTLGGYTVCLYCGEIFNATAPLGHSWVTKTESTASCTQNGCEHHECSVCGIGYNTYTPAIGHNYLIDSEEKATCTATGSITYKCSHCNDVYTVTTAKLNHNYIVEIVEATCTESGYTKKVCHTCGAEVHTNVENPLGHSFGNVWVKTSEGHYHVCERCGEIDEIHIHIPGAEATETTAQICTECGYVLEPALGHTCKSHLSKIDSVNADCLNNGNVEYYVCDCGKWYLDEDAEQLITDHLSVIINALGHDDTENRSPIEPSCTEVGYTAGVWCKRCQKYVSGHIEIPAKGHSYTAVVTKPTCENDGYTTYTCSCGHSYVGNKTEKLGHNYLDEIIAPTCTEKGYTKHTCINCDDTSNINEVSALGHAWKIEYETDKDYHWHICSRCNELNEKEAHISDYTEATEEHGITCTECGYVIAERLNHVHAGTKHDAVPATCTTSGNYEYYVCSCGEWFYDADCTRNVTNKSLIIISPFGHIKTLYTRVEPTCTEYGYTEGYYCEVCKQWLSGHEKLEKDGNNHVHVVYHEAVERTCTKDGHDEYWECLDCHGVYSDKDCTVYGYVVDKAWGHLYETTVVEPKCEEGGYDLHVCSVCGDEYRDNETMPIDHAYNIAERKDATCQEEGYIVWVCIHDLSHSYRQTLPIVSHDYQVTETVEQTCTTGGYKVYTCRFCGDSYHCEEVGPRGHISCEWYSDETYHWHICVECNEICDKEEHKPNFEEATTEHGIRCMLCDYVIEPILEIQYTWSAESYNDVSGEVINAIEFYTNKSLIWTETMKSYGYETVRLKGTWSQPAESIISAVIDELGVFSFKINDDGTLTKQEDPTEEVKYTFDATITIEDMTITQHIDLYSNGVAKVWAVAGLERQELEGVWVEKDGEVTITINNDPQVYYVNEDGKTLTQGNKPIEPTGKLVYTYDDDTNGMILHYEFYDDNTMFATAKSNGQVYATINGTWEIKDGKVVATFDGGEEIYTINGDGTLSPYEEPTEPTDEEFIKAFDSSNFENVTVDNPMGKQMFDYNNGLVFVEMDMGSSFQIMLYDGNWYKKENGNWSKAQESDYSGFTYENMVGSFEAYKQFDHYYKDGAWIVNMYGEIEVPFYIENDKIVYESTMSEKDAHFYDYGTTVIEIPEDLLDFIEKQGEEPEKEVVYTANFYWHELDFAVKFYTDYTFDAEVQRDGKEIFSGGADWEYVDGKVLAYFNGDPLFFEIKGDELIFVDPEGDKEFVRYDYSLYPDGGELTFYLGSTRNDVVEVIKNTQFHYVKYGITKNDEWWTLEEKSVTLSDNNIGDISVIDFNTIDSIGFPIIYEGISFNIYARVIPDLRNATIVETFIYETVKYYEYDQPVMGLRYVTLYDNGCASYHYKNEDNYSYCAYEKATNGDDELVKIVSYGQGMYLKKTPETKDGYHFYVDYKHGEKESTEYRLYMVGSGLEIKLYVFDDKFCEYYSNEPEDIENFSYQGTIDIVLSEDKTEITFMDSTYTIDENNMLIITLPDEQPEIEILYMDVASLKLYNGGKMFYVMEDVVVAQGDWYNIDGATVCISMMGMDQIFYKWKVDGNWYGEEEPDFENAEVIKCKKQGEDTQYTLYLFSDWWDAYLNDGTSFIDCYYEENINIITIYGLYSEYYYLCNGVLSPATYYDVRSTSGVYGSAYLVESMGVAIINLGSLTDHDMAELGYSINGNEITFTIGETTVSCVMEGKTIIYNDEPTEPTDEEFIKAFDPNNFENVTVDNPMGKQMFDYNNGLVFVEMDMGSSFQIMLYDGNWYKKENGNWSKAQESDYSGFTYENMVGSFEAYKQFDHYYKDGAWIVNMYGEIEVPFYIENDKIVYESTMSEKDAHFYDYGTTVIEIPEDLLDFIEKQGEEPEKEVQYTGVMEKTEGGQTVQLLFTLYTDGTALIVAMGDEMPATWEINNGIVKVDMMGMMTFMFTVGDDNMTLVVYDPSEGATVLYTSEYAEFGATFEFYEGGKASMIYGGAKNPGDWAYVGEGKIGANFMGQPMAFAVNEGKTELTYISDMGNTEYYQWKFTFSDENRTLLYTSEVLEFVDDGNGKKIGSTEYNVEQTKLIVNYVVSADGVNFVPFSSGNVSEYELGITVFCLTINGTSFSPSHYIKGSYRENYFNRAILYEDGTCKCGYDREGYEHKATGTWEKEGDVYILNLVGYGKLYYNARPYDGYDIKTELVPIEVKGEILYTYSNVPKYGYDTIRLFDNGLAKYSGWSSQLVFEYSLQDNNVICGEKISGELFKGNVNVLGDDWTVGGEEEVISIRDFYTYGNTNFSIGKGSYEDIRFSVRYTDNSEKIINYNELDSVEGSIDFNTAGKYTLTVEYEGHRLMQTYLIGNASDIRSRSMNGSNFVWFVDDNGVVMPDFNNVEVGSSNYDGRWSSIKLTAEDFDQDELNNALNGKVGGKYIIHTSDYCRIEDGDVLDKLYITVILLTEDMIKENIDWVSLNGNSSFVYDLENKKFIESEYTTMPSYRVSVKMVEETIETWEDEKGIHEVVNTRYENYAYFKPFSFDDVILPETGDTYLTKAGKYTYRIKLLFGWEIDNTLTVLSFDANTQIMFMGAVCDMNNSHNPVIDLPEMQVGESISNYTEEVVSFINDNDNICVMVAWVTADTMDGIYEIQLDTVSADMFDFSKVDSSKVGTQEGYLFIKDYNGNTTTITLAVRVV